MKNLIILFACFLIVLGCTRKEGTETVYKNADTIVVNVPLDTLCSEQVRAVSYLPLSNSNKDFIANPTKIRFTSQNIIVISKRENKVIVYKNDGTFLYVLDKQGRGPKEYMEIANACVSDKYIYIVDNVKKKILQYNLADGNFYDSKDIDFVAWDMEILRPDRFLFTFLPNNPTGRVTSTQPKGSVWITDSTYKQIEVAYFPYEDDYYEMVGKDVYFTQSGDGVVFHSFQADGFYIFKENEVAYVDFKAPNPIPRGEHVTNAEAYEKGYFFITETPVVGDTYTMLSVGHEGYDEPMLYNHSQKTVSINKEEDSYNTILPMLAVHDGKFYSYLADSDLYEELVSTGFVRADPEIENLLCSGGACLIAYEMK